MVEVFYNMCMKTVSSIFNAAMVPFSGAKIKSIRSQTAIVSGAMDAVLSQVTLVESRSVIPLVPALFYGDNLYSIPQNEVGEIIDVKPMKGISSESYPGERQSSRALSFDTENIKQYISIEYREGVQYLNIQHPLSNGITMTLSNCDLLTGITASLDASNLALNSVYTKENSAIDFDLGITNLDGKIVFAIDSLDLSGITRDGTIQASVFVPEGLVGKLTNLRLELANEVGFTNKVIMTATANAFGGAFSYGWQPVRFNYRSKVENGTFVETAVTYFSIDLVHTLTVPVVGVKIDSVKAFKGTGYELHFYNQKHFKSVAGVMLNEPATNDSLVIANENATQLIVHECRKLIDFELRGEDGGTQYTLAERALNGIFPNAGLYEKYRLMYPSERLPEISDY